MKQKGFTLIELLVVVAIIGILAAVGVTTFSGFQEKAKIAIIKSRHAEVVKFINAELTVVAYGLAEIGSGNDPIREYTKRDGTKYKTTVNISAKDSNTYAYTFMNHFWGLDYKNPFDETQPGVYTSSATKGQTGITGFDPNQGDNPCPIKVNCYAVISKINDNASDDIITYITDIRY
jgi:type IV pilus assembly protein PilA